MSSLRFNNVIFIVLRSTALLALYTIGLITYIPSAFAWNMPDETAFVKKYQENTPDDQKQPYIPHKKYHKRGHAYIIEHAIDVLDNDGYRNYAGIAREFGQELLDGARYADIKDGRQRIYIAFEPFNLLDPFDFIPKIELKEIKNFSIAGQGHYFNPDPHTYNPKGFNPNIRRFEDGDRSGYNIPEKVVLKTLGDTANLISILTQYGISKVPGGGITNFYGNFQLVLEPTDLRTHFPSAIENFENVYKEAKKTWKIGNYYKAMEYLGEALHLLGDLAMVDHTYAHDDLFNSNHSDYEDAADGKGNNPEFHAKSGGRYDLLDNGREAWEFLYLLAKKIHSNLEMKKAVDAGNYERPLKESLPLAEQYTAGLIAKFFHEMGVKPEGNPVKGRVYAKGGEPIPGAYVFFKEVGKIGRCLWRQTDEYGIYHLWLPHGAEYWLRPAMMGYIFEGANISEFEKGSHVVINYSLFQDYNKDFFLKSISIPKAATKKSSPAESNKQFDMSALLKNKLPILATNQWAISHGAASSAKAGGVVTDTMADMINDAGINIKSESKFLGVKNGGTEFPDSTLVTIQILLMANMKTGDIIQNSKELDSVVQSVKEGPIGATSVVSWEKLKTMLPQKKIVDAKGEKQTCFSLIGRDNLQSEYVGTVPPLFKHGIIPVIPKAGIKIVIEIVEHEFMLGLPKPMIITTNDSGRAFVKVNAGSNPGPLTIRARVIENPTALQIKPQAQIELMVQPNFEKVDVNPPKFGELSSTYYQKVTTKKPHKTASYKVTVEKGKVVSVTSSVDPGLGYTKIQNGAEIAEVSNMIMEQDVDRAGMDYKSFDLQSADPDLCREACEKDPKCQAYTYVKPSVQGPKARCWLKHSVPPAKKNSCCISGVRKAIPVVSPYLKAVQPPKVEMSTGYVTAQKGGQQVDLSGTWNSNIGLVYKISQNGNKISYQDPMMHKPVNGVIDGKTVAVSWMEGNNLKELKGTITSMESDNRAKTISWVNKVIFNRLSTTPTQPPKLEMAPGYVIGQTGSQAVDISGTWNSNIGLVYNISQNGNKISYQDPMMHKPVNGVIDGKTVTVSWAEGNASKELKGTITLVGNDGKAKRIEWQNSVVYHR